MNERSPLQRGMLGKQTGQREADKEKRARLERDEDGEDMIKNMLTLNPLHGVYYMGAGRVSLVDVLLESINGTTLVIL